MTRETPDMLRHRIAIYRRYLSEGVDGELARSYLNEIMKAEVALRDLESHERQNTRSDG
jgi:hypothetical protein